MDIHHLNKRVGVFRLRDKTFITYRDTKKHLFVKFKGYGISIAVIKQLKALYCENIIIVESCSDLTRRKISTTLLNYLEKAKHYKDKKADNQLILHIREFDKE